MIYDKIIFHDILKVRRSMISLDDLINNITPPDALAYQASVDKWNGLAKPLGSLGELENCINNIASVTCSTDIALSKRTLFVFCADNGVVAEGVSQSDESVTSAVALALGKGTSTVNYMAAKSSCRVVPVDVGIKDFPGCSGVIARRVRNSTGNIAVMPAMSREECIKAVMTGAHLAVDEAADVLLIGEMSIGNTTTSAALAAVLLDMPPEKLVGRGAGLSDAGLVRKTAAVKRAIELQYYDREDVISVMSALGGLDIAAMCGVCLGAAFSKKPVILDGFIADVAAYCAYLLSPHCVSSMIASHVSAEPAAKYILDKMSLHPLISAGLRLGEGTGAVAALPLLDLALSVYNSGNTFAHLGIDAYVPQ